MPNRIRPKCELCGEVLRNAGRRRLLGNYHEECAWHVKPCDVCGDDMALCRSWPLAPTAHDACEVGGELSEHSCIKCGNVFRVATGGLASHAGRRRGDERPRCPECVRDNLLLAAALTAVKKYYPFSITANVETRGVILCSKVVVLRVKKTGDVFAEAKMSSGRLVLTHMVNPTSLTE